MSNCQAKTGKNGVMTFNQHKRKERKSNVVQTRQ